MKPLFGYFALATALAAGSAHASLVDLTTFTFDRVSAGSTVTANLATLTNQVVLAGTNLMGITSLDYRFDYSGVPGLTRFDISNPDDPYSDILVQKSVGLGRSGSTGWLTYTFAQPYSGTLEFSLLNTNDLDASTAFIRNVVSNAVVTSPVPEPETCAMLMAGLGVMAAVARRRKKSARAAVCAA